MDVSLSELREMVMDREAWRAAIHGVVKSRARLSDWTELKYYQKENSWKHYELNTHLVLRLRLENLLKVFLSRSDFSHGNLDV